LLRLQRSLPKKAKDSPTAAKKMPPLGFSVAVLLSYWPKTTAFCAPTQQAQRLLENGHLLLVRILIRI